MHHLRVSERMLVAGVWVGLSIAATMISLKLVYGLDPIEEYSVMGIGVDVFNFAAVLIAGYVTTSHTKKPALEPVIDHEALNRKRKEISTKSQVPNNK